MYTQCIELDASLNPWTDRVMKSSPLLHCNYFLFRTFVLPFYPLWISQIPKNMGQKIHYSPNWEIKLCVCLGLDRDRVNRSTDCACVQIRFAWCRCCGQWSIAGDNVVLLTCCGSITQWQILYARGVGCSPDRTCQNSKFGFKCGFNPSPQLYLHSSTAHLSKM